jgi:hypothetical protein
MPCRKTPPGAIGVGPHWASGAYATEEECNQACKEGACCEGTVCTVKPQCQCQGAGKFFAGVGATCTPDPCLVCGCVSRTSAPQKLYARFSGFSNFVHTSSAFLSNPPRPSGAESAAAGWLNTIVAEIPATVNLAATSSVDRVIYGTAGCPAITQGSVRQPCSGCAPPFYAPINDGSGDIGAGISIRFPCNGGFVLPIWNRFGEQRPRWWIGPAVGCGEPSGLSGWITTIEILFSSSQQQQDWCSIAQGLTQSFALNAEASSMTVLFNNFSVTSRHSYIGSGGTVTLSTNPLP